MPAELRQVVEESKPVPEMSPVGRIVTGALYVGAVISPELREIAETHAIPVSDLIDQGNVERATAAGIIKTIYGLTNANVAYHTIARARAFIKDSDINGYKPDAFRELNEARNWVVRAESGKKLAEAKKKLVADGWKTS